jgi:hypothetical protein
LLSFDVLIQILGLEEAGPGFDPTVFAPILSSIIAYQLSPALGTYTTEDLAWMLDLEERCADLPPTAVEDLAIEINRARLSGKDKDDPELRLQIQRGFQKRKLSLAGDLDSTRETLRHTDSQLTDALEKRKILEDAYRSTRTRELRGQATRRLIQSGSVNLLIGLVFALGAVYLTLSSVSFEQRATFWGLLLTAFSFAFIFFIRIFHTVVPSYRTELANIEGVVASEVVHMFEPNR